MTSARHYMREFVTVAIVVTVVFIGIGLAIGIASRQEQAIVATPAVGDGDAFHAGAVAADAGEPATGNPYQESKQRNAWSQGYRWSAAWATRVNTDKPE